MRFSNSEKILLQSQLSKWKQTQAYDTSKIALIQEVENRVENNQIIVGNYLHFLFIELKHIISDSTSSEEEIYALKLLNQKILRRINANK